MALIEMQYNGQSNLIIGKRTVKPGQTFYIDDQEIADYINPTYISTGLITYVNNDGLPAGTISASLVIMQQQTAISAGDLQTAMSQISSFMTTVSGTIAGLVTSGTSNLSQIQTNGSSITTLQTNLSNVSDEVTVNTNNINSINTNLTNVTNQVNTINTEISTINVEIGEKLNKVLFQANVSFSGSTTSTMITHNIGNENYAVMVTPTSNPGSGTFWVQKDLNDVIVNITTLEPGMPVTADVVIMS